MVDKFPDHEDFKRLLSIVNQEMDMNVRDYKTVFPHLFAKVFEFLPSVVTSLLLLMTM